MTAYVLDQPETLRDQLIARLRDANHAQLKVVASALSEAEQEPPPVYDDEGIRIPEALIVRSEEQLARELAERRRRGEYVESADMWASVLRDFK